MEKEAFARQLRPANVADEVKARIEVLENQIKHCDGEILTRSTEIADLSLKLLALAKRRKEWLGLVAAAGLELPA